MGLPNFLIGGAGVYFISNFKLIILSGICTSGNSVVIRTSSNSNHIANDVIIKIYINDLLTKIILYEVG